MIKLHYLPSTASMAPHILLEEIGAPFELVLIDKDGGELDSPAYRAMNPNGLIPVLRDGDLVMYEAAAICLHLADTHPEAGLMPPVGSHERAVAYKWLSWLSTTLQPALMSYFSPARYAGTDDAIAQVKQFAQQRAMQLAQQIDVQLASHGKDWLLGDHFSVVDIYGMMLCRWTRNFDGAKARELPHVGPWLQRILARPAVGRAFEREGIVPPLV
jgi:glutathione S-transferase